MLGAVAMALLLPALAALRYTDAHDWYAARRVSVAQALIAAGFDERAPTDYRLADGLTVTWLRDGVATYPAALRSRNFILSTCRREGAEPPNRRSMARLARQPLRGAP